MRLFDRIYGRRCDCEHFSNVADSPTDAADMLHDFVQCVGVCGAAVIVNAALEACQRSRVGFHGRTHIPRRGTKRVEMFMADVRHRSDNTPVRSHSFARWTIRRQPRRRKAQCSAISVLLKS